MKNKSAEDTETGNGPLATDEEARIRFLLDKARDKSLSRAERDQAADDLIKTIFQD